MNRTADDKHAKYRIKVLQKAFRLLELFGDEALELTVPEINQRLHYNKTTTFRIIANLEEEGYLEKNPETGKYRLGMKLFFLGSLVKPYRYLRSAARPLLEQLNKQSDETVHLAVLHKGEALYLSKLESSHTVRVVISQEGHKLPAHCSGVGKVLLAHLPPEEAKGIVEERGLPAFTQHTITTWKNLEAELQRIRAQGYALDNEEIEIGLKCVAAPVFFEGSVVAGLSVSVPRERFDQNQPALIAMVTRAARELSQVLQDSIGDMRPASGGQTAAG
ncbi:MAG: IclR family transcriptional regulator [Desulfarculus sp.]|jgi:DNA-binding IclR family transcriptional regulator|nr:MAG: IclR family transcriptional regulator [Desulfarculus sp.]